MMTKEQFEEVMGKMEKVFNKSVPSSQMDAYRHYLSQVLTIAEFQTAAKKIILHNDTFPSLAAIIRAAEIEV